MIKKVILVGPVLSNSGYGEHARTVLRSLIANINKFNIYIKPTAWGQTSNDNADTPENNFIKDCIKRTELYKGEYDFSIQVGLPNEWQKLAPVNIGVTAAVETDRCNAKWIQHCNEVDHVITISEHAYKSLANHKYELADKQGNAAGILQLQTPVTVVGYPVKNFEETNFSAKLDILENCFLSVCQLAPRKNVFTMLKNFVEEFKDEEVGLLLKINMVKDSITDRNNTIRTLNAWLKSIDPKNERKCKIHVLHGRLSDEDMNSLYKDDRVKAYITTTHGEGYGLPIFEAAYSGLPVVAPNWSGHLDFLKAPVTNEKSGKTKIKSLFLKTRCLVKEVAKEAVMPEIIIEGSRWAYVDDDHFKKNLRSALSGNALYKKEAKLLQEHLNTEYTLEAINQKFLDVYTRVVPGLSQLQDLDDDAFTLFKAEN